MLSALYLLLATFLLASMPAMAAGPVLLPDTEFDDSITSYASVFKDAENRLTIQDLLDHDIQRRFTPSHATTLRFGETDSTYWIRFSIDNSYPSPRQLVVTLGNNRFSHITLYNISVPGQYQKIEPSNDIPLPADHFLQAHPYLLELPERTTSSYLMKVSSNGLLNSDIRLVSLHTYAANEEYYSVVQSMISGWLLATAAYFIHLAASRRFLLAGYAALYCLSGILFGAAWVGQLSFIDMLPLGQNQIALLSVATMLLSRSLFCYHLAWIGPYAPRSRNGTLLPLAISISLIAIEMLIGTNRIESLIPAALFLTELGLLVVSITGETRHKNSQILLSISTLFSMTMTAIVILTNFNLMEQDTWSFWSAFMIPIGVATLMVIMMMLLLNQPITGLRSTSRRVMADSRLLEKISQELVTPTNNVMGAHELLQDTPLTDHQRDYLETLQFSAIELRQVSSELMDLARIQDEYLKLSQAPFDIIKAAMPIVSLFHKRTSQRKVELLLDHEDEFNAHVIGDEVRFRTLLYHLLRGLLDHLQEGNFSIHMANTSPGRDSLCMQIRMTGRITKRDILQGFTDALRENDKHLIDKHIADLSWNLLILQQLLSFMQVAVELESLNSRVLSITLYTPMEMADALQSQPHHNDDSLIGTSALILADNPQLRKLLDKQVRRWGVRPQTTHNAKEALAMLRNQCSLEQPFDIMILDQDMTSITPQELTLKINEDKEIQPKPNLSVLTNSHTGREHAQTDSEDTGQLIEKPVSSEVLKSALLALNNRSLTSSVQD